MRRERNGTLVEEEEEGDRREALPSKGDLQKKSKRRKEESGNSDDSDDDRSRSRKRHRRRKSRRDPSSESGSGSDSEGSGSRSESDGSGSSSEESESDSRRRKRRERRKEKETRNERKKRRKERERKRVREEEEKKKKKRRRGRETEEKRNKKTTKDKDLGKRGAVTNSWGKYGVIKETDMWNKRPEFTAWLLEVKQVNMETLSNWEEKQMFKQFMEDHNTATFPSKKYYDLDAYHRRKMEKEMKKGHKIVKDTERIVFNDEEQRRQELLIERGRQKEEQVEALKRSMQSGMAQAMKEQARLREEMAYQYRVGNFEAAAAIQKRLDPDVPM